MDERALAGYEKALGPGHTSTLKLVNNLGLLYSDQNRFLEADTAFCRVLYTRRDGQSGAEFQTAIEALAYVFDKAVRQDNHDRDVATTAISNSLFRFVQHVKQWARLDKITLRSLARALIRVNEDEDASVAYS